jgi:hypothetical protein
VIPGPEMAEARVRRHLSVAKISFRACQDPHRRTGL